MRVPDVEVSIPIVNGAALAPGQRVVRGEVEAFEEFYRAHTRPLDADRP